MFDFSNFSVGGCWGQPLLLFWWNSNSHYSWSHQTPWFKKIIDSSTPSESFRKTCFNMRHPVIPDSTCSWFLDSTLISIEFTAMAVMNPPERKLAKPLCSYETYKKLYKHIKLETLQIKLLLIHTIVIVFLFFQVTSIACLSTVLTASRPYQEWGSLGFPIFQIGE